MAEVYALLADLDGTTFSHEQPIGIALSSKEEADKWVATSNFGYSRSYQRIVLCGAASEVQDTYNKEFWCSR